MDNSVNLNAELGESFGAWRMGDDAALMGLINSANVACGFHGGDPLVMRETVRAARRQGVSIGAHPAFPDLQGFGRRRMEIPAAELEAMLIYQIGALAAIAATEGAHITHVKPHGALSNMACEDAALAATVARAIAAVGRKLILLAPAASHLVGAGNAAGLVVVEEIFADRTYADDGQLVPRKQENAFIHGAENALRHVLSMLRANAVISVNGRRINARPRSICVHGDGPAAIAIARALATGLREAGYSLLPLPELLA